MAIGSLKLRPEAPLPLATLAPRRDRESMLALRPACERCATELPPDAEAFICSFECTFCPACTASFEAQCPNCAGELVRRPTRRAELLERFPPVPANGLLPSIPVLSVTSDERSEEFYGRLGFETRNLYSPHEGKRDPAYRVVRRDQAWIHLDSFPGDRQGPGHVYLRVADVDAIEAELRAQGIEPVLPAADQPWGTREMVVHDPDGNELHFHQE